MYKISKHSIKTRIVPKKDAKEVMMDFKKIYTAHNLSNAKSEYENFKKKYKLELIEIFGERYIKYIEANS